jgi:predicted DNA-binding WGR domain protein
MSDWAVELEFEEGTSSKFWRARVEGKTLYVNYGKIGSPGQTQVKDFASAAVAQTELEKLIREKRKKGYVDSSGGGDDEDDDEDDETEDEDEDEGEDDDDEEEEPAPKSRPAAKPKKAAAAAGGAPDARLVLSAGSRRVETALYIDGTTVRMDSTETYASPEAAQKAFERLQKTLVGEGYKPS